MLCYKVESFIVQRSLPMSFEELYITNVDTWKKVNCFIEIIWKSHVFYILFCKRKLQDVGRWRQYIALGDLWCLGMIFGTFRLARTRLVQVIYGYGTMFENLSLNDPPEAKLHILNSGVRADQSKSLLAQGTFVAK